MKALWLENGQLSMRDLSVPEISNGEALIRMITAGVCGTDLELKRGYKNFIGIPGHEFVGEVVKAEGDLDWIGKRVVGEINIGCGECRLCRIGLSKHCLHRCSLGITNWNGVFAEYFKLPIKNLHAVPQCVSDEQAVFTEPLAAALEIQEQVHIRITDRVLVIGAGRFGQLIAQTLALTGSNFHVVVRDLHQRQLLHDRNIRTITFEEVEERSYDVVIEASGAHELFALARKAVRPAGCIVMKSTYHGDAIVDLSSLVVDEIKLVGSRCGPFPPALRLLETRQVDPLPLINARYSLDDSVKALNHAAQHGVIKVIIQAA